MTKKKMNILSYIDIITPWLTEQIQNGKIYYKSYEIAEALPVTIRQVASCLSILSDDTEHPLAVSRWGTSGSTTWKITLREPKAAENPKRQTGNDTVSNHVSMHA